ncbi:Striatin-interacting protein 2 [Tyrophagus putrescentiae]|nr:Striatin-interacting protein 2 [Tyrophagus putrescentiae]
MAIPTLSPPSSENIDFTYSDTDVHLKELAELYSYNEELDFTVNRTSFEELMEDYGYPLKWTQALPGQRASADSSSGSDGASWCPSHNDDAFISGQFTCDLCQVAISGGRSYQMHLRFKGHRARQAAETAKRREEQTVAVGDDDDSLETESFRSFQMGKFTKRILASTSGNVPGSKVSLVLAGLPRGSEISGTAEATELTLLALVLACPVVEILSNAHFLNFGH